MPPVLLLLFQLCVQSPETGEWYPSDFGLTVSIRQDAILALGATANDQCTLISTAPRAFYVKGSFAEVKRRLGSIER